MKKTHTQYISELDTLYLEETYCKNGCCPFFQQCSENMERPKIKCDYATRVGENYGQGNYPKVVIMGQESVHYHNEHMPPAQSLKDANNEHYRKTLYTLAMCLKGIQPKAYSVKALKNYEFLLTHYCLTNYYKCAFSDDKDKVNGLDHSKSMKENCYKILLKELDILEPDLLVVQGKFTTRHFWDSLDERYGEGKRIWGNYEKETDTISLYQHTMNKKPFYVLYSYHPSAIHYWSKTKRDLKTAIDAFRNRFCA